eukprot:2351230-Amphidinium_carterae.1
MTFLVIAGYLLSFKAQVLTEEKLSPLPNTQGLFTRSPQLTLKLWECTILACCCISVIQKRMWFPPSSRLHTICPRCQCLEMCKQTGSAKSQQSLMLHALGIDIWGSSLDSAERCVTVQALEIQSPTGQMVKDDSQQMFVAR